MPQHDYKRQLLSHTLLVVYMNPRTKVHHLNIGSILVPIYYCIGMLDVMAAWAYQHSVHSLCHIPIHTNI